MLAEWLPSDDIALATRRGGLTWSELLAEISVQAAKLEQFRGKRVGVLLAPSPQMIAVLLACEHACVHAFLIASDVSAEQIDAWSHRFGLSAIADGSSLTTTSPPEANPAKPNQPHADEEASTDAVTILTSGTTGEPKAVEHTWESFDSTGSSDRW